MKVFGRKPAKILRQFEKHRCDGQVTATMHPARNGHPFLPHKLPQTAWSTLARYLVPDHQDNKLSGQTRICAGGASQGEIPDRERFSRRSQTGKAAGAPADTPPPLG